MNTVLYDEDILSDFVTSKGGKKDCFVSYHLLDTSKRFMAKAKKSDYFVFISSFNETIDKLETAPSVLVPNKIRTFSSDSSTKKNIKYISTEDFLKKHRGTFVSLLSNTKVGDDNFLEIEDMFENLLKEDKGGALKLLEEIYVSSLESTDNVDNLQASILKIICSYSYDELKPTAQLIVSVSYNIKSIRVKSSVFNVFGHWANMESLNMLNKFEEPTESWLRMKYRALINSIQKKYVVHQKD